MKIFVVRSLIHRKDEDMKELHDLIAKQIPSGVVAVPCTCEYSVEEVSGTMVGFATADGEIEIRRCDDVQVNESN